MTVMEFLVFCHKHIHAHRQRGKLGGGDSQPHAINAPEGGQQEQRGQLEHQAKVANFLPALILAPIALAIYDRVAAMF